MLTTVDHLVIGGGIVGLAVARELAQRFPQDRIVLIEKEPEVGQHASGRNSGVLHAGFYYTADSLKAKLTRDGNAALRAFCKDKGLALNDCGKLVVAKTAEENLALEELKRRGERNGVELAWLTASEAMRIEPNVRTYERALWSPSTATVDPLQVCLALRRDVEDAGVELLLGTRFLSRRGKAVTTSRGVTEAGTVYNCAGLYADRVARSYGLAKDLVILPFKGLYLKYDGVETPVRTNVYPVPNLEHPFLGVHFTVTVDGTVKIGPTATPAFWRENYAGLSGFRLRELAETLWCEAQLFARNAFGFRRLAVTESRKYHRAFFVALAAALVQRLDAAAFRTWSRPGIRAQLLDKRTCTLVQDFLVEREPDSVHVLNAVSPAFTCALPMAKHVVDLIR